jgi:ectoine hydroxylase-related dioxygenase (phytanoyl-CoA dioxygenase family)
MKHFSQSGIAHDIEATGLTRTLKPVLPADVERRLNEPPAAAIRESLAEPYALDREQIEHYREHGFVKLKQVISGATLRYFRKMIGYAVGHYFVDDDRAPADKRVYERSFLQAVNLWTTYPAIQPFAHAYRFADLARRLMGIRGVRLWFDQALYKQPGGRLTDYHKDAAFWPVQPAAHTTTIWVALVDVPRERGCMAFAAGSHRVGNDPEFVDIFSVTEDLAPPGELAWQWVPLAAGDCTFHSGCVFHRAGANRTSAMREAMTVAYISADATYDWPDWNARVEHADGVGTAGLRRGDPLNNPSTPQLA